MEPDNDLAWYKAQYEERCQHALNLEQEVQALRHALEQARQVLVFHTQFEVPREEQVRSLTHAAERTERALANAR